MAPESYTVGFDAGAIETKVDLREHPWMMLRGWTPVLGRWVWMPMHRRLPLNPTGGKLEVLWWGAAGCSLLRNREAHVKYLPDRVIRCVG